MPLRPPSIHPSMHLLFCLPPPTNTCYQIYKSLNFTLMQDEYLTSVSGYVKYDCSEFPCVSQLTFTTNLGKTYGPYGGGVEPFEVNVEYDEIKGFFGQATTEYLTAFGVYHWIHIDQFIVKSVGLLKYDFQVNRNIITPCRSSINPNLSFSYHCASNTMSLIFQAKLVKFDFVDDTFPHPQFFDRLECWKVLDSNSNLIKFVLMELTRGSGAIDASDLVDISRSFFDCKGVCFLTNLALIIGNTINILSTLQEGFLSQHHVDSKYSEMLGSCISKEAFDVVIFYVCFEKGSTPTSIWTMCPSKIGAKHELRYARKVRTDVFDVPRNGGERHAWNSSPSEPPYLGVTRVVPSISKVILMEFTHEAAPTLMPVILSAGSMPQRDSLSHGHLRKPHPRACAAVLITFEACTTMHPSQTK
ncbi:unnamed protein product [Musa acuminata var. zebrina]